METEQESDALWSLGQALAGLSGKLEAKAAQPLAAALLKRMETEQESDALSRLGEALARLSGRLDAKGAQPLVAMVAEATKTRNDFEAVPGMAAAWVTLEPIAYGKLDDRKRVQAYVDLLPPALGGGRRSEGIARWPRSAHRREVRRRPVAVRGLGDGIGRRQGAVARPRRPMSRRI